MSEYLAAAAAAVGAPEELVMRSASARAEAQGSSVEDILHAWAGGEAFAPSEVVAKPMTPEPSPEPQQQEEPVFPPEGVVAPEPDVPQEPVAVEQPLTVAEDELELLEPAALGERMGLAAKLGGVAGAVLGVVAAVAASPLLLNRATLVIDDESIFSAVEVTPLPFVASLAVASLVFGALVARLARTVPGWLQANLSVEGGGRAATVVGGAVGLALGAAGAGVSLTLGREGSTEGAVALGVWGMFVLLVAGGAVLGAITAAVSQAVAIPVALGEGERESVAEVRSRLGTGFVGPVFVILGILVLVVGLGSLLVAYPTAAPIIAIVVAGGILAFTSLAASRPGMRITAGEFAVAAAGVGTVILFIVLITNAVSGGGVAEG